MIDFIKAYVDRSTDEISQPIQQNISANLAVIKETRERIKVRSKQKIVFAQPIISSNGQGCVFPNTITVIQGRKGVHKSRLTEILSVVLVTTTPGKEVAGFRQSCYGRFSLLYVDSERNQNDQFPAAIQRIKMMAGYQMSEDPPNLDYISLVDISRNERFETLKEYIEDFRKSHAGHVVIVLDVLTDCVENFNDPRESMKLIDLMNALVNQHDVSFICVIHENPGEGSKARGHLGTEVVNKASQVMQIGFEKDANKHDTDLIRLNFLHSRNTKRLEPVFLKYSDEVKSLILAEADFVKEQQQKRKTKGAPTEVKAWLLENLTMPTSKKDLIEVLKSYFECGDRVLEERLSELTRDGFLKRTQPGREAFYEVIQDDEVPF